MYNLVNKHVIALFHSCMSICTFPVSRPSQYLWDTEKVDTLWWKYSSKDDEMMQYIKVYTIEEYIEIHMAAERLCNLLID